MQYRLEADTGKINLSPHAFRLWARQFYQCRLSFRYEDFSPVPYFLLCRAIELYFKAIHLEGKEGQQHVKLNYRHDLVESYKHLPAAHQTLSSEQVALLRKASEIYKSKGFEYVNVSQALRGFSDFPDLSALDVLAAKIVGG